MTEHAAGGGAHPPFDRLNDYADGLLGPAERAAVERHVSACAECRAELDTLRRVLALAAAAPRAVEPPDAVWTEVRARIRGAEPAPSVRRPWWRRRTALGAAGLLAAASVAVIVTRDGASPARDESPVRVVFHGDHTDADSATLRTFADSLTAHRPGSPGARPGWLLRLARSVEADLRGEPAPCVAAEGCLRVGPEVARQTVALDDAAAELRTTLVAGAAPLPPDARASLERSLRVVDTAIAEARAELARDPANAAVASALAAGQERRVELLRQAARLLVEI